jgi:hypothetical protein
MVKIKSTDIDQSRFSEENHSELKAQFPELNDDIIARYLIARDNDLEAATELLSKAEKWRSLHYPILKEDCVNELSKGTFYTHGVDKEDRPLFIVHGIRHDPSTRDIVELAKAVLWMGEQVIKRLPADKSQYTVLLDLTDCGLAQTDIDFCRQFTSLFLSQHPERLHRAIVFPSGLIFNSTWAVCKLFFDPITADKVCPVNELSEIEEYIDSQYIPECIVRCFSFFTKTEVKLFLSFK